jgi:polyhydroxyalkanoate synthesis regulator phasin
MANEIKVEGTWLDKITGPASHTLTKLRENFSLTSAAEVALGQISAQAITQFIQSAARKAEELTKLYIGEERSQSRLEAALVKSGQAREGALDSLKAYADQLEKTTRFDDDSIRAAESLALTLGKARVEDVIPMTRAAADLASVLGTDVPDAMRLIIKGGQGMEGALSRVGIQFKSTGDSAADMQAIMKLIGTQMGGLAEKELGAVERKLHEMDMAIKNNDEALGKNLGNWSIWSKGVQKILSDFAVGINDYSGAVDLFQLRREQKKGRVSGGGPTQFLTPWSGAMGNTTPTLGIGAPTGPAAAYSGTSRDGVAKPGKAGKAASPPPLGSIPITSDMATEAFGDPTMQAFRDAQRLGQTIDDMGEASTRTNRALDDMIRERERETEKLQEAKQRAHDVSATLIGGLRQMEEQGRISTRAIGQMLIRMAEDFAWKMAQKGLEGLLNGLLTGASSNGTPAGNSDLPVERLG